MYMPKSAVPVGQQPSATPQPQQNSYMPKSAVPVQAQDQQAGNGQASNPLASILGPLGTFGIQGLFPQTTKTISDAVQHPQNYAPNMGDTVGEIAGPLGAILGGGNVANKTKQAGLEMASYGVPIGSTMKGALGAGVLSGILQGASQNNANPQSITTSAVTGGIANGAMHGTGAVVNKMGTDLSGAADELALKGLRPSQSKINGFQDKTGMDIAQFMKDNNITGDFSQTAEQKLHDLYDQYDTLASNPNVKVPMTTLQQNFQAKMQPFTDSIHQSLKDKATDMQNLVAAIGTKYKGAPTLADVVDERRQIDDLLKQGQFSLQPEQANYLKNSRDALKATIDQMTEGQTKQVGQQINHWEAFNNVAKNAPSGRGNLPMKLIPSVMTSGGATVAGLPGLLAGYLGTLAMNHPKVIGAEVQGLRGAGNAMKSLSGAGANSKIAGGLDFLQRLLRGAAGNAVNPQQ